MPEINIGHHVKWRLELSDLDENLMAVLFFLIFPNIILRENQSSDSRVVLCIQTDGLT
jgi:hypothetical protein